MVSIVCLCIKLGEWVILTSQPWMAEPTASMAGENTSYWSMYPREIAHHSLSCKEGLLLQTAPETTLALSFQHLLLEYQDQSAFRLACNEVTHTSCIEMHLIIVFLKVSIGDGQIHIYSTGQGTVQNITEYLSQVNDTYNTTGGETELTHDTENSIRAVFSNGAGGTFTLEAGILNYVLSLPNSFVGQTRGLLGNNNGNQSDDFVRRGELHPLPDSMSEAEIFQFGQTCKQQDCMDTQLLFFLTFYII